MKGSKRAKVTFQLFTDWELCQTRTNTLNKGRPQEGVAALLQGNSEFSVAESGVHRLSDQVRDGRVRPECEGSCMPILVV